MGREIKFRVWDKILNCWSHNSMDWIYGEGFIRPDCGDRYIFVPFTGLHDKNGKEIYEFDVVRFDGHTNEEKFTAKIIFKNGGFWADRTDGLGDYLGNFKYTEIIGNVFEHGHLLGDK